MRLRHLTNFFLEWNSSFLNLFILRLWLSLNVLDNNKLLCSLWWLFKLILIWNCLLFKNLLISSLTSASLLFFLLLIGTISLSILIIALLTYNSFNIDLSSLLYWLS